MSLTAARAHVIAGPIVAPGRPGRVSPLTAAEQSPAAYGPMDDLAVHPWRPRVAMGDTG